MHCCVLLLQLGKAHAFQHVLPILVTAVNVTVVTYQVIISYDMAIMQAAHPHLNVLGKPSRGGGFTVVRFLAAGLYGVHFLCLVAAAFCCGCAG
jgi:hypothetical protein